jgi:XRE family transcriptional regulator, regulator of sulfur utilization
VPRRYEPQYALGRIARRRRVELDLTQEEVAARADIAKMHLSKIENGSGNPSLGTLRRLAAALELSTADLVKQIEREDVEAGSHSP